MSVLHEEHSDPVDGRMYVFPGVMLIALIIFLARFWYLQVARHEELKEKAAAMRATRLDHDAPRGLIVDRAGVLLAGVRQQMVITCIPRAAKSNPNLLVEVARILEVDPKDLEKRLTENTIRQTLKVTIHTGVTMRQAIQIAERLDLNGVFVETQPTRFYPETRVYAHTLGYVRAPDEKDVARIKEQGQVAASMVGKQGLERTHEVHLMGQVGQEEVVLDNLDKPVRTVSFEPAIPGQKLVLGLQDELQRFTWNLMADRTGCVVALEPKTGEVLAMVSKPSYDAKIFLGQLSSGTYEQLAEDPETPLINRAISTATAPGSTFKIVTTLAAMQKGIFHPHNTFVCSRGLQVGNRFIACTGSHGRVSYHRAMQQSCNAYFMALALQLGPTSLAQTATRLGFGERTGVDLIGESKGLNPTPEWIEKAKARNKQFGWYRGQTAYFGIGQGELAATPIQMANLLALVANRGVAYKPHFVHAREFSDGTVIPEKPEPGSQITGISAEQWEILFSSLGSVISEGTARSAQVPGLKWGGKTGSAERRGQNLTDSWFVGVAPLDDPKIVICVRLEGAGHGGAVAAPLAKEVVAKYLKLGAYAPNRTATSPNSLARVETASARTGSPAAR